MSSAPKSLLDFCKSVGVEPQISPGMDPAGPTVRGPGDARYALGVELGRGGQGRVLYGLDRNMRRNVAIKLLPPERHKDPVKVQAFLEEAIITGGLEHPNIVPAYELGYSEQLGIYYTMKRLTGRSLHDVLSFVRTGAQEALRNFGLFRLLMYFSDMCRAIAYAHSRGVIHTDLKPANVLIGDYGEVVIVDWGLAQILGPAGYRQARARVRAGTAEYMSPEQAYGPSTRLDGRTDVWALGAILYEILTLQMPFVGKSVEETLRKVIGDPLPRPSERAPGRNIPEGIENICIRALKKDANERYPSVRALLADVEAYVDGTRDQMRRFEQARRALSEVRAILTPMAATEHRVDLLLTKLRTGQGKPEDEARVHELAGELAEAYASATGAVLRGREAKSGLPQLNEAAGDLYWRVFGRVYPSQVEAKPEIKKQGMELLATISRTALAAVVQVGQRLSRISGPIEAPNAEASEDAWLSTVVAFCQRQSTVTSNSLPSSMNALARRIEVLRRVSLFSEMFACDLLPIADACEEIYKDDHQPYFEQNDVGDALYVIMEGLVDVVRDGSVLNTVGQGEVFGEIAILGAQRRTASVISAGTSRCLRLDAERFREIVRDNGVIGWGVVQVLSKRLADATDREAAFRASVSVEF